MGRTIARFYTSHRIAVDDGFFFLAVTTFVAGTIALYFDIPYIYLQEEVMAGLRAPPVNLVEQLIQDEKLRVATGVLLGTAVVSVKFSFLFFFRGLARQQKRLMIWWWCILVILIFTAAILMFSGFMSCPYFDQEIFVQCVTPAALSRVNGLLKARVILDIVTDAFRTPHSPTLLP